MDASALLNELACLLLAIIWMTYHIIERCVVLVVPTSWRRRKSIAGEIALVTGAGHGLGRELALRLARQGAVVVLWDINETLNRETKNLIAAEGGAAHAYTCDVAVYDQVKNTSEAVARDVGSVTILINNAGIIGSCERIVNTPPDFVENTFRVNVFSQFWTVKTFLPEMLQNNHGHIVNIGSVLAFTGQDKLASYCSTKHAVHGFHESLVWEIKALDKTGVNTTLIAPFAFNSGMFAGLSIKFPWLTPFLKTENVADRIITALLLNEDMVIIPGAMAAMAIVKALLPWKTMMRANEYLGATTHTANLQSKVSSSTTSTTTTATVLQNNHI